MFKHAISLVLFLYALSIPILAFAQDAVISNDEFITYLIESIGGMSGLSILAISGIIVQIAIKFLNTELMDKWFSKQKGSAKLTIVTGLTLVLGVLNLMSYQGLGFLPALLHSSTLAAAMVFFHQVYKQFTAK